MDGTPMDPKHHCTKLDAAILRAQLSNKYMIIVANLDGFNSVQVFLEGTGFPSDAVGPMFTKIHSDIMKKGIKKIDGGS